MRCGNNERTWAWIFFILFCLVTTSVTLGIVALVRALTRKDCASGAHWAPACE